MCCEAGGVCGVLGVPLLPGDFCELLVNFFLGGFLLKLRRLCYAECVTLKLN